MRVCAALTALLAGSLAGCSTIPSAVPSHEDAQVLPPHAVADAHTASIPARTPASVMKIWIAPWEDGQGDLHAASHVYVAVQGHRWTLGEGASQPVLRPLQVEQRETTPGQGAEKRKPASRPSSPLSARGHASGV